MSIDPARRRNRHFLFAGYATCLAIAVAAEQSLLARHDYLGRVHPGPVWIACFASFASAMTLFTLAGERLARRWSFLLVIAQTAAVVEMARIDGNAATAGLLVLIAWQVAMATSAARAYLYAAGQSLLVLIAFREAWPVLEYCVFVASFVALQGFAIAAADALRVQAGTAKRLEDALTDLRAAQSMLAELARESERTHISRELHDAWGHELTALCLQLEIASHVAPPGAAANRVRQARALAASLLGRVRDVVGSLRGTTGRELFDGLEALVQSIERPKIHLAVDRCAAEALVTPYQAHAILRCAQEAITNAIRHSAARNLWIELVISDRGSRLIITDDGKGSDGDLTARGLGLRGMRERLNELGGRIDIATGADRGFRIEAIVPRAVA